MSNNGKLTPKLRFPEFRKGPGWEEAKLSTRVDLISGVHLAPDQYANKGGVPYFTGPSDFTNYIHSINKWTSTTANAATAHDTLITVKGSGVGELWYLTLPTVAMGRQLMAVRAKAESSQFIYQFLTTKRSRFEDLASGNLIPGLSRGDILDMVAPFPSPAEQQKIADCLSSLDDLIAAAGRKLESLRAYKKGLMQQLFPRDGETTPRLRFPEFRKAGEWEESRVEDHGEVLAGKALAAEAPGPQRPYLRTKNVLDGAIDVSDVLRMPMTDAEFDRFELLVGDILLNEGHSLELVGRTSMYRGEFGQR